MGVDLENCLVIGISSRALFDLKQEDRIFRTEGLEAYRAYQTARESDILPPGTGFPLVRAMLGLNQAGSERQVEVVVMSRNAGETSLRIFHSIRHYGLDISRAALTGGAPLAPYLDAFKVDLFLSGYEDDVRRALDSQVAAALLYDRPTDPLEELGQIRIAFDGDAILFSDESERIFQEQGLDAFIAHEALHAHEPLGEGPFARFLHKLAAIQRQAAQTEAPIRTALVTARGGPAHERVIRTLIHWGVNIDETFFMGGVPKTEILKAFKPHVFFDDQQAHCDRAADSVPTGRVPERVREPDA
jgi:5'-nucleotidase